MSTKPSVHCVVAARPNFVKVAPILSEIEQRGTLNALLVHTGQHFDENMSARVLRDLGVRAPDACLGIGGGSHAEQIGRLMMEFEQWCLQNRPDVVLVFGDVNATLACSLVASKLQIRVAHVEAGLRSGDRSMPEEINRIVTDQLSDLLFTTSRKANENLRREGIAAEKIHFTGNVMVDSLLANLPRTEPAAVVRRVFGDAPTERDYAVLTLHRPSNVDSRENLEGWIDALEAVSRRITLVCPVHPRTAGRLREFGLRDRFRRAVTATDPLGYLEFLGLLRRARLVITDSGGLQEETTVLGLPCLTIRDNTERPETLNQGSNRLVGGRPGNLLGVVEETLESRNPGGPRRPELWDGRAAARIVDVLAADLGAE